MAVCCRLPADQLASRRAEIARDLRPLVKESVSLEHGVELRFDGADDIVQRVTDFIAFERRCCDFLTFELRVPAEGDVVLRLTGPPGSEEFLRAAIG
jgi:hypothetical protein